MADISNAKADIADLKTLISQLCRLLDVLVLALLLRADAAQAFSSRHDSSFLVKGPVIRSE
jgi:hypothetical protein